jgi:hypothetical protein
MRKRLYDKDFNIDSTELVDIKTMSTVPLSHGPISIIPPDTCGEFYIHEFDGSEKDDLDISKTFHISAHTVYAEGKSCYGITYLFEMDYTISEKKHEIEMKIASPTYADNKNLLKTKDFTDVIGCTICHDATISAADEDYDAFYDICDTIIDAYDKIFSMNYDEFISLIKAIKDTSLTCVLVENFDVHITDKVLNVFAHLIESLVKKTSMKFIDRMAPMEGDYLNCNGYYYKTNGPVSLMVDSDGIFHRDASDAVVEDDLGSTVSDWLMDKCEMPAVIYYIMTTDSRTRNIVYDMPIDDAISMLTKLYAARIQCTEYNPFGMEDASDVEYAWNCILDKIKLYARYTECALRVVGNYYHHRDSDEDCDTYALTIQSLLSDIGSMNKKLDRRYVYLAYLDDTELSEIIQPILDNKIDDEWNSKYADTFKKMTNPNTKVRYELVVD